MEPYPEDVPGFRENPIHKTATFSDSRLYIEDNVLKERPLSEG